jgi:DNA-binding FadR family transcriptional regulator
MELAEDNLESHGIAALEIHRTVAEASGNTLLRSVAGIVELTLALALKSLGKLDIAPYRAATFDAHTALVEAMEKGIATAARDASEAVIAADEQRARTLLDRPTEAV